MGAKTKVYIYIVHNHSNSSTDSTVYVKTWKMFRKLNILHLALFTVYNPWLWFGFNMQLISSWNNFLYCIFQFSSTVGISSDGNNLRAWIHMRAANILSPTNKKINLIEKNSSQKNSCFHSMLLIQLTIRNIQIYLHYMSIIIHTFSVNNCLVFLSVEFIQRSID